MIIIVLSILFVEVFREVGNGLGTKMSLVHCSYCSTFSSATTISKRWRRQRRRTPRVVANAASAREKSDDERTNRIIIIEEILNASTPERTLGIQEEEEEDEAKRRVNARKAFSNRVKLIHPDVCEDERSAEATEKCVRAYAWLLNREEEFEREDTNKNTNNVYGSVFVNEILCVGASNCPSYSNCTVTAREYFRVNPKTKAARFERSEKSNPLNAATGSGKSGASQRWNSVRDDACTGWTRSKRKRVRKNYKKL